MLIDNSQIYTQHLEKLSALSKEITRKTKLQPLELASLSIFISTLVIGKFIQLFAPAEEIFNYFNNKRNILNVVFVKQGWAWTTVAIVVFYSLQLKKTTANKQSVITSAVLKYVAATLWWWFFTQWFFGLPIMDRIFMVTGGKCINIPSKTLEAFLQKFPGSENAFEAMKDSTSYESKISSAVCRSIGGRMFGGHDPSGHVFLLIHSSLYLIFETLPFLDLAVYIQSFMRTASILLSSSRTWSVKVNSVVVFSQNNPFTIIILLSLLWWWMLLMTSIYFHSFAEKIVGLIWGYLGISSLYILPRFIQQRV